MPTAPTHPGTYAVVATINESNYMGSAAGTLAIAAASISAWREHHFTTAEIADGLAADGTDPEGDGFTNLAEYTLGTGPHAISPQPLAIAAAPGNHFTLTFLARGATGPAVPVPRVLVQTIPPPATRCQISGLPKIGGEGRVPPCTKR